VATRVPDHSLIDDVGDTDFDRVVIALIRVDFEFNALPTVLLERTNFERMQSRSSRARIDFRLDVAKPELRQLHPFTPPKRPSDPGIVVE
jgi:predicted nucleotidyltransferase